MIIVALRARLSAPAAELWTMSSITNLREITMRTSRRVNCSGVPETAHEAAGMTRRLTVLGAVISSLIGASAMGQQAPASSASDSTELQEIVVTGSMIKRVNAETAEAITVVKMDTLKDMGVTTVEQALALVTSNNATVTTASNVATFNGGASVASCAAWVQPRPWYCWMASGLRTTSLWEAESI